MIEKLTAMYEKDNLDASHVKVYVIGGDNVDPKTLQRENDILLKRCMASKIIFGYGSTEAFPIATTSEDERSHVDGSTGYTYPGVTIKIIDPDTGKELQNGEQGEVYAHTPNLMLGYVNNEEENQKVLVNIDGVKFFKTGDKGYLTDKGILFLTGRYKRMMKRPDGHQTSPIPIENAINSSDLVEDCAVVGITSKNGQHGVIPTAFVVLKNQQNLINSGQIENVIKVLAEESLEKLSGEREGALAYVITDKIPYTINGKVDFPQLESKKFDDLSFYVIEDPVTADYFHDMPNISIIKISKGKSRTLNK